VAQNTKDPDIRISTSRSTLFHLLVDALSLYYCHYLIASKIVATFWGSPEMQEVRKMRKTMRLAAMQEASRTEFRTPTMIRDALGVLAAC
jgi:hypothetical protein